MRRYIRHPFEIPIEYQVTGGHFGHDKLLNFSAGGLCFHARIGLSPGTGIRLQIPIRKPPFVAMGVVAWCRAGEGGYEIGVRFPPEVSEFALRMVEQICHIERYRLDASRRLGREVTTEEAASEWIERYAAQFPRGFGTS